MARVGIAFAASDSFEAADTDTESDAIGEPCWNNVTGHTCRSRISSAA
jgi:hypothetical protein